VGHFPAFWKEPARAYTRTDLFRLVTLDAGYSAKQTAKLIDDDGFGDVLRIKGEQPTLLDEMWRILQPRAGQPEGASPWESVKGKQVQRRMVRRSEIVVLTWSSTAGRTRDRPGWCGPWCGTRTVEVPPKPGEAHPDVPGRPPGRPPRRVDARLPGPVATLGAGLRLLPDERASTTPSAATRT